MQHLLQRAQPGQLYDEGQDMQPRLMAGLRAAARALQSDLALLDTHSSGLLNPRADMTAATWQHP